MDIKDEEGSSGGIGLEFNTDDPSQFVSFDGEEAVHLVIHPDAQLEIPSSSLEVPSQGATTIVTGADGGVQEEVDEVEAVDAGQGLDEGTINAVTAVSVEETPPEECEEMMDDLYGESRAKKHSLNINQAWFTGKHAKESLQEQGHSWRQGMWSKEEVAILMKNIEDYVKANKLNDPMQVIFQVKKEERKDFYRTIAAGLNRPLFAVYRRVQRMYDSKNYVGRYSSADIERLKHLRAQLGNDWAQIGARMGRSASSVKDKCRLLKDSCLRGKWSFDEEERLTEAVYDVTQTTPGQSITGGIPWQQVAEKVRTRTEKQCRAKWLNYLNWKHTGGTEWDKDDDDKLLDKIKDSNVKDEQSLPWEHMARGWKSVRSPQWLRSKWWTLKRTVPNHDIYTMQDLVEHLKKNHRKQRLRGDRYSGQIGHPPMKVARVQVPQIGSLKNNTLTLHLPLPLNQTGATTTITTASIPQHCTTEQLGALTETFSLSQVPSSSSGPLLLQSLTSHGGIATIAGNRIVVRSLPAGTVPHNKQQVSVQLHQTSANQLIITTNQESEDEGHDGARSHGSSDDLDVRVSLHDSHLGEASDPPHDITPGDVDHLTTEISQSDTDHTDTGEDHQLSSKSQLIGRDAVLSQQEVTSSELQVASQDTERTLVIVRSVPPSEGLVQSGSGGVDGTHLENSVFTLSASLLSCQNDHSDLLDPSTELEVKTKLSSSPHS